MKSWYTNTGKRIIDITAAITGLTFAAPILLVLTPLVRIKFGKPAIFKQLRSGLNGTPFNVYKLRTMREAYDSEGNPLPDEDRLTPFGHFLRKYSLDELPQLFNVLKGDISLVGPRPLVQEYIDLYTEEQARRLRVKPGITGWAQINGRNAIPWEKKFELDVWYVDHISFWVDLKIILSTPYVVLAAKNVSAKNHVTMPVFQGTRSRKVNSIQPSRS